ncbi:MAG: hypothetical protein ACLR4Z_10485 [Butyricicoccaceae bacterium]
MKKRLLAALLSAVLLLTLVPTAFAASDLDGHWAKNISTILRMRTSSIPLRRPANTSRMQR